MDVYSYRIAESCVHSTMRILNRHSIPGVCDTSVVLSITICLLCCLFYSSDVSTITLGAKLYHTVVLIYITLMDNDFDYFSWAIGFL